jgi:multidrug efflux pump subunit AcrA (membrane-fusion protein)
MTGKAAIAGVVLLAAAAGVGAAAGPAEGEPILGRGMLKPEADIQLYARGGGIVASIPRLEGDTVGPGEPVVQLEDADEKSRTASAKADLDAAEVAYEKVKAGPRPEDLERARALYEESKAGLALAERTLKSDAELATGGFLSELGRQRSERSLEAARAQCESRRLDLVILEKSPRPDELRLAELEVVRRRTTYEERRREEARRGISGTRPGKALVSRVLVDAGMWVDGSRAVAELVYLERVRVDLDLPGAAALSIPRGAKALVKAAAFPDAVLEGRVERVAPVVDPASGTVKVVVLAANPGLRFRSGVEAEVEIRP